MGLLSVLTKEGRWTKHLPKGPRENAELISALRGYERLRAQKGPQLHAHPLDPKVMHLEDRLERLLDRAGGGDLEGRAPRVLGGQKVNPKSGLSPLEELLGLGSKEMRGFRPEKRTPPRFSGEIPGPPPGPAEPKGWDAFSKAWKERSQGRGQFLDDLLERMKGLREFATKNKKPLLYAGAGAGALGLGLLGLQAATKKRHEELRGKAVDNQ